mmetsp:Transcript_9115/g.20598  ORF Transcript_9115/g.20598 Transcript_9115/m.20598 type:complete len:220 (+) Transcript_9115:541-1200(+)
MLSETRYFQVPVPLNLSSGGYQVTSHQLDKGGFACSVRPDKCHTSVKINTKINLTVQFLTTWVCKANILNCQNWDRQLASIGEAPIPLRIFFGQWGQSSCQLLFQQLFTSLCLTHHFHSSVTEAGNEVLNVGDITLFGLVLSHLDHVLSSPRFHIGVVVSTVVAKLFVGHIQPYDVGAHSVHEILGMANKEKDLGPFREIFLQPQNGVHIQMVCGLVQE